MSIESWFYLVLICLMGASSPGPSLLVILRYAVADGRNAGINAAIGHGIGIFIYALVSAMGLSFILISSPKIFSIIQILGAIFLMWIGFQVLRGVLSKRDVQNLEEYTTSSGGPALNHFRDGFGIAILNPKILAFFSSLFSQFLSPEQTFSIHMSMAIIAGFIDISVYIIIVFLVTLKSLLKFYREKIFLFEIVFGFLLILLGFSIFIVNFNLTNFG